MWKLLKKTQICFVSDQSDPNLLPIICNESRPEKVVLLSTTSMTGKGKDKSLYKAINDYTEASPSIIKIPSGEENDLLRFKDSLVSLIQANPDCAVNITGGLKTMAIAAFMACQETQTSYFYLNHQDHSIYLFANGCSTPEKMNFPDVRPSFECYLTAHGYNITDGTPFRNLKTNLAEDKFYQFCLSNECRSEIKALNQCASEAFNNEDLEGSFGHVQGKLRDLLDLAENARWIEQLVPLNGRHRILFKNEDARFMLNGGWLEHAVAHKVKDIIESELGLLNIKVEEVHEVDNELDVVFFHNNRLHLIEVKTKRLSELGDPQEILQKLKTLADLTGGAKAKACLVTYFSPKHKFRNRAQQMEIEVIDGSKVCTPNALEKNLKEWILK